MAPRVASRVLSRWRRPQLGVEGALHRARARELTFGSVGEARKNQTGFSNKQFLFVQIWISPSNARTDGSAIDFVFIGQSSL